MDSIWTQTAELPQFAPLDGDLKTDVLVIGGGLAGLLCAYWLTRAGADCALVEADRLCGGVTGNTTAKLTFQHGLIYGRLLREFGPEKARLYLEANRGALGKYRELCREIDCEFEERDSYVYALPDRRKLDRELEALSRLGFPAEFARTPALPMPTAGAVRFPKQAQFHPLKFAAAIAKGLRIFEHTKVLELAPGTAVTDRGTVTAEKIVIATHFPPTCWPWKTPRRWGACTWMRGRRDCPSGITGTIFSWAAAGTGPGRRAAAGGNWRRSPGSTIPRPASPPAGQPRTA